jgi:coniferyl-aldehyde dehydrogenase
MVFREGQAVVTGGPDVGAMFSGLPFDHLFFTGSTQVGRKVMKAASENLVPVTLELGGKSPVIVARGHVDDSTMSSIVFGKLANAGQTCVAPAYALVHEHDREAFVAQYKATVDRFYPDGPASEDYTSIVSDRHYDRLTLLVEDARHKGASVIAAGVKPESAAGRPRTFPPTLIVGARDDMMVMQEEIFGPILPVRTYRTMNEVIAYVNGLPRPLALYYFGAKDVECETLLQRTTSGNVGINNTIMHVAQDDLRSEALGLVGWGLTMAWRAFAR